VSREQLDVEHLNAEQDVVNDFGKQLDPPTAQAMSEERTRGRGGGGIDLKEGGAFAGGGFLRTFCNSKTDAPKSSMTDLTPRG
jgi:hypothetical protein